MLSPSLLTSHFHLVSFSWFCSVVLAVGICSFVNHLASVRQLLWILILWISQFTDLQCFQIGWFVLFGYVVLSWFFVFLTRSLFSLLCPEEQLPPARRLYRVEVMRIAYWWSLLDMRELSIAGYSWSPMILNGNELHRVAEILGGGPASLPSLLHGGKPHSAYFTDLSEN